jgi:hypothetical protein
MRTISIDNDLAIFNLKRRWCFIGFPSGEIFAVKEINPLIDLCFFLTAIK